MEYELSDLVDVNKLQHLMDSFYNITGVSSGILGRNSIIITTNSYMDVCKKFHISNPISRVYCIKSVQYISKQFESGKTLVSFKCKNGLIRICTPIIIGEKHIATIILSEIFFKKPNMEFFELQAEKLGFDKEEYITAIRNIPIVNKKHYEKTIIFLKDLANVIGEMGLRQLKLLESQRKLQLSEERYKLSIYGSNDGMWDWNLIDKSFYASDRFLEILGHAPDKGISFFQCVKKFVYPQDRMNVLKKFHEHLKYRTSHFSREVRIKTNNGNYKWVLFRGAAIFNDKGTAIRMAGSLTDLSELKKAEQLLKKEQNFSKIIVDNANVMICIWSPEGKLLSFNEYGKKISGFCDDDVLGYNWVNTVPKDFAKTLIKYIRSMSSGYTVTQRYAYFLCKDGSTLDIFWDNKILKNDDNSVKNILSIGLDITERINEERRLMEFFSNISHELRTPLNIIFSYLQLMDLYINNDSICDNLNKFISHKNSMKQNCYRLLRLVNNLIDITKIDSGYFTLDMKKCNIVSLIENITLSIAEYVETKGLTLTFDTNTEEKIIYCDPDKIERIILNLLSNAVKFTRPGDSILVNLEDRGQDIIISVKDTGIGIEADKLNIIFERFKQANKSFTREHEGSGIGLSLVKSLVKMHFGTINVKSIYGEGSEFIIELPSAACNLVETAIASEEFYDKHQSNSKQFYDKHQSNIEKVNIEFSDIYFM